MKVCPDNSRVIARLHGAGTFARMAGKKISDQLCRRRVGLVGEMESLLFNLPLPVHPGEDTFTGKILGFYSNQKSGVGVFSVPGGITHPIRDDTSDFGGSGEYLTTGTHTESEGASSVWQMNVQTVIRGRKCTTFLAILGDINIGLSVLDPHSHGESLSFHRNSLASECFKSVSGGVTDGQNRVMAWEQVLLPVRTAHRESGQGTIFRLQGGHLVAEADFTTKSDHLPPNITDDIDENISPNVGFGIIANGFRSSVESKLFQNPRDPGIMCSSVQLPVRKGPCTAFTELNIILGIQRPAGLKTVNRLSAREGFLSTLQDNGPKSRFGKNQ